MKESAKLDIWYETFVEYMVGIKKQVTTNQTNVHKMHELYHYLNELDRRRSTDWKSIYPWLVTHFNKLNICI